MTVKGEGTGRRDFNVCLPFLSRATYPRFATANEFTRMRAFLRWAGSKKQLLPQLEGYWQGDGTYPEPFRGVVVPLFPP
jgi:hypothetical protein